VVCRRVDVAFCQGPAGDSPLPPPRGERRIAGHRHKSVPGLVVYPTFPQYCLFRALFLNFVRPEEDFLTPYERIIKRVSRVLLPNPCPPVHPWLNDFGLCLRAHLLGFETFRALVSPCAQKAPAEEQAPRPN